MLAKISGEEKRANREMKDWGNETEGGNDSGADLACKRVKHETGERSKTA